MQLINNYVTIHINTRYYLCVIAMYPTCKWQLGDYYGIIIKQIQLLENLMLMWFFIHPSTNLMLHDFSFIHSQTIFFLMSFAIRCLIMSSNVFYGIDFSIIKQLKYNLQCKCVNLANTLNHYPNFDKHCKFGIHHYL